MRKSVPPKSAVPPMSRVELKACLAALGATQTALARGFGRDPRTVRRWGRETPVPPELAMLLRLMVRAGIEMPIEFRAPDITIREMIDESLKAANRATEAR